MRCVTCQKIKKFQTLNNFQPSHKKIEVTLRWNDWNWIAQCEEEACHLPLDKCVCSTH